MCFTCTVRVQALVRTWLCVGFPHWHLILSCIRTCRCSARFGPGFLVDRCSQHLRGASRAPLGAHRGRRAAGALPRACATRSHQRQARHGERERPARHTRLSRTAARARQVLQGYHSNHCASLELVTYSVRVLQTDLLY